MASSARRQVAVTGAAGFIGSACVAEFLARGWRVSALVHRSVSPELARHRGNRNLRIVSASVGRQADLLTALSGEEYQALVHCAGRATDIGWDSQFRRLNLGGVENVCRAVKQLPIGRLVHMSTTDVYGVRDFDNADEQTPLENNRHNPYAKYKIMAEEHIRRRLPTERFVILRPAFVWGPGDRTVMPRVVAFLRQAPFIPHFGRWRGCNRWPLAYVGNVSRTALAAATCGAALGKAYNIADFETTSLDEYYRIIIDLYLPRKRGMPGICLPLWAVWPLALLSTALSTLLGRRHPLFDPSIYGLRHIAHSQDFNSEKVRRLLAANGLAPITRADALQQMRAEHVQ